ncbi:MAG: menaquinone biosynthesis protein [Thermoanaerobacteraceae bacterium]|nr:menaquinone biosynthesis protein [Thermoanaerobacteraceae bacterium]
MAKKQINLGIVDSLDYMPLIDAIESGKILMGVNLIKDTSQGLHDRFLKGEIDIAPLPSIEYAEHFKECVILPDLSLTAAGDASDLLLFSKVPVTQLHGGTICVPHTAVSSHALLRILIDHYFQMEVSYIYDEPNLGRMLQQADAALLYEDRALVARDQFAAYHVLDLGKLWKEFTKEPVVYALWLAREQFARKNPVQVDFIVSALHAAKDFGMKNMSRLVEKAKQRYNLSAETLEVYFQSLRHKFDQPYRRALLRYFAHAQICGIIPPKVTLKIWGEETI